ncbi:MAG: universal stress protein [Halobacteriales archaeon]|nr:universal stress protein [Halobacteriales archaeon]
MYEEVLVATDGSEPAERAADHAVEICRRFDARLHVLHAVSPSITEVLSSENVETALEEATSAGEVLVEDVAEKARSEDVDVVTRVEQRAPHEAILEYTEENDVDLVVMGSRGRSEKSIRDRLLGGVSAKVVRMSEKSVLTVR